MKSIDKISIVIPVYNAEKTLERCTKSILNQTYTNIEVIFINDGSLDNSGHILKHFEKLDNRIRYISLKNGGVSRTRNIGISQAKGKYIAFVDADDIIECTMMEKLYLAVQQYNADIAICKYDTELIEGTHNEVAESVAISKTELLNELMLPKQDIDSFVWNRLYRSDLIKNNNIQFDENIKVCEDTLFNFQCTMAADKLVLVPCHLYHYRINRDSVMFRTVFNPDKLTANKAYEIIIKKAEGNCKKNAEVGCMLFNVIIMFQVCKYGYKLDKNDINSIKKHLKLNGLTFMKSEVKLKYKFGYWLVRCCPRILSLIYKGA